MENTIPASVETGWLIERDQLCLGIKCGHPCWVSYCDQAAVRFARKLDAMNMLLSYRNFGETSRAFKENK